jgi:hypothetical protein
MRRRDFIKGIVGSATVGSLAARTYAGSAEGDADLLADLADEVIE